MVATTAGVATTDGDARPPQPGAGGIERIDAADVGASAPAQETRSLIRPGRVKGGLGVAQ